MVNFNDIIREDNLEGDKQVIEEAKRRFKYCQDYYSVANQRGIQDIKFVNGDTDNKYQWPDSIRTGRETQKRPCITVNKTRQHCLHIINDAKQNTPGIKIIPVGDEASFESAQVAEGIVRHIENISKATTVYDYCSQYQVWCGISYMRLATEYYDENSFNQEIFIRSIKNPFNVYLDTDINEFDGSDAMFGFIFSDLSKEDIHTEYPKYEIISSNPALDEITTFIDENHVRVVEYFRRTPKKDKLIVVTDPNTGQRSVHKWSKLSKELRSQVNDFPGSEERDIVNHVVERYLIIGDQIAEKSIWPGKYIPIIRVIGEETVIDGQIDRKGHVRALKDSQRMFNYAASTCAEIASLQSKSPYIAAAQAIEGLETYWASANTDNHAVLPYNHLDDDGNPIPQPQRQDPPQPSAAFLQLMQDSDKQMDLASGQFEATFGQQSNEKSGKAIDARQRQGETATYHYIDNLAIAIRFLGKQIIDLIPKIYDVPRVIRILGKDNTTSEVFLHPEADKAYREKKNKLTGEVMRIFNPNVGTYDVEVDVGPNYKTQRDEAFNALTQIISQQPGALTLVGDLWAENADFPTSDKIAERLRNLIPPQALGAPSPEMQQMQQQLQQLQAVNSKLMDKIAEDQIKRKDYEAQKDIDIYKAETERLRLQLETIASHTLTPRDEVMLKHELAKQEHQNNMQVVQSVINQDLIAQNQANQAAQQQQALQEQTTQGQ